MITGLTHAAIQVTDIDRAIDFYEKVLGLPEQFRLTNEEGKPWLVYLRITPNQFIELFPSAKGSHSRAECAAVVHICLEVDDIQKSYTEFTRKGLVPHGEPVMGADGSWQFWTCDPDGNPIEFHQFTPESRQITG